MTAVTKTRAAQARVMCTEAKPVGRRRRKPEGTVRKSCVRVRCRRHTKRRRNSKLANDKKTAEVKNARRGRKSDNAPAAKVAVVSARKNPIPLRLGL